MITSYNTLMPIDNMHAVAVDIDIAIKPIPVGLKGIDFDVVALITNVSIDFSIVVSVLFFLYFFFESLFLSLKYVIVSLMLLIEILKLLISVHSFSNLCSRSIFYFQMVYWDKIYHIFDPFV